MTLYYYNKNLKKLGKRKLCFQKDWKIIPNFNKEREALYYNENGMINTISKTMYAKCFNNEAIKVGLYCQIGRNG